MRTLSLDEIKERELSILKAFVETCEHEGYYYTLAYGTLLGAIRHRGFIPWDDDIDVFMPRPDCERFFAKYSRSGLNGNLAVIGPRNGGDTSYLKVVDLSTHSKSADLTDAAHANDHLWIDIFPLDGMPRNPIWIVLQTWIVKFFHRIRGLITCKPRTDRSWLRRTNRKFFKFLFRHLTANQIVMFQDRLATKYGISDSKYIGNFSYGGYESFRRFPKLPFLSPVKVNFENLSLNAPSNYDEVLKMAYGDYMKLPPADQRVTHQLHVEVDD